MSVTLLIKLTLSMWLNTWLDECDWLEECTILTNARSEIDVIKLTLYV